MSDDDELLFTPPKGKKYRHNDYKITSKSTPLPLYQIPIYLLDPTRVPGWYRPVLWAGWVIEQDEVYKIIEARYPDKLERTKSGQILKTDSVLLWGDYIRDEFKIPEEFEERVDVVDIFNPDGSIGLALTVGNNYLNIIPRPFIDKIANTFFGGQDPQWYLWTMRWQWAPHKLTWEEVRQRAQAHLKKQAEAAEAAAATDIIKTTASANAKKTEATAVS